MRGGAAEESGSGGGSARAWPECTPAPHPRPLENARGGRVRTQGRECHRVAVPMHCRAGPAGWQRTESMKDRGFRTPTAPNIATESSVAETKVRKGSAALRLRGIGLGGRDAGESEVSKRSQPNLWIQSLNHARPILSPRSRTRRRPAGPLARLTSEVIARWPRQSDQPRDGHCPSGGPPRARVRGTDQGMRHSNRPDGRSPTAFPGAPCGLRQIEDRTFVRG
jgi:hypothetical protein